MKIMVMSDEESSYIWEHLDKSVFEGVDMILAAGDLKSEYLEYVVTMSNKPVFYVHGNHDEKYKVNPPEGCECIEDDIIEYQGVRILGLGGSMRYRSGLYQYNEKQMQRRIRHLWLKLRSYGGFDILLTHAPAAGFHDTNDPNDICHRGFEAFNELLDKYKPNYPIHGHIHMNYGTKAPRVAQNKQTTVNNAYRYFTFHFRDTVTEKTKELTQNK